MRLPSAERSRFARFCRAARRTALAGVAVLACLLLPDRGLALDPARDILQYNCQTWSRQNGLPANGVNAITQTKDGYLWLGTQSGMVRFDGVQFSSIHLPVGSQFPIQLVSSLASSPTGGLWFGMTDGSFGFRDEPGAFSRPDDAKWLDPRINVISLCEASDGSVWVGASVGLARYVKGNPGASFFDNRFHTVIGVGEDAQKRVWLMTAGEGLHYWQEGKITAFPDDSLKQAQVNAAVVDHQGQIWVGSTTGLRCYDSSFQRKEIPPFTKAVGALLVDQHGVVWIGTTTDGLACYKNGTFSFLGQSDGLANNFVTSLCEDREGSLWIGTRAGLSQLTDVKFPIYSAAQGVLGGLCHGVSPSANGGLWIGTNLGVSYFDGIKATNITTKEGLSEPYIKRTFEAKNGDVYLINGKRLIDVLSRGKVVATFSPGGWPTAFAEDSQGVLVAVDGTLFRVSRAGLLPYELKDRPVPPLTWIHDILTSRDGALWVASVNGILRLKDGTIRQWTTADGLSDQDPFVLCEDREGAIWAGLKTGMARIKGDQVRNISRRDGLSDDSIYAIVPDDHDHFWLNSSQGIFRVSWQTLNAFADGKLGRVESVVFNGQNVVKTIDTTEVEYIGCKTTDGRIWFPTPLGAVAIDPARIPVSPITPPVRIERVRANARELPPGGRLVVPPGPGELEIHFTALSFVAPQKLRFRYRLEGYDPAWVETDNRRQAFYTNLEPGRYTFRVTAANADGVWDPTGAAFEFELHPHFYQATWFYLLGGALGLGVLAGIHRWRIGALHRREQALQENRLLLENEVRHRTAELQNEVVVRQHAEEQLRAARDGLEAKNRELETFSYSVSHDLRTPLRSIDGFSRVLLEDYAAKLDDAGKDSLRRVCVASQRMGQLIDDLLNLARVSRDKMCHGPVDLSAVAGAVAEGLRQAHPNQRMEFVITPGLVAHGDARLLQLVLENLLGNAVKFSSRQPVSRIEFGRTVHAGAPAFFVRDNGSGFDSGAAPKLFEAFQRFHTTAEFPGTGIGLATVQRIVHRHGGSIEAESRPDHGATFTFILPVQPQEAP